MISKIVYQLILDKNTDFGLKEETADKIKELLDYEGIDLEKTLILDCVNIGYLKDIGENKFISNLCLEIPDNILPKGGISKRILEQFNDWLKDQERIKFVFKYRDDFLLNNLDNYYKEIFEIEMDLREVISFIFIDTYENDFYNLLNEFDIQPQFRPKDKSKIRKELEKRFKDNFENDFFYLLFPDYQRFSKIKSIKIDDIIHLLGNSNNFKELQDKINNRGINKEEYNEFLNSIKYDLCGIENMRNCVAHNRIPTDEEITSYDFSKPKIQQKIIDFWQQLQKQ